MPSPPDWHRILALFDEALERPPADRQQWLQVTCGGDPQILAEVERLLKAHEQDAGLLDRPMEPLAVEALDEIQGDRQQIGPYRIIGELGRGGMGVVYRAQDTRLGRQVALKVLPRLLSNDAHRMARFHREAQTLAALNHPNIASLYGLEDSDGTYALVIELVEGPTLGDRIEHGPLVVEEVVLIACQIADALESAHEKGIIHRDLKPHNIKVTSGGTVKILDFGLAKALDEEADLGNPRQSPTLTLATTPAGLLLGTAGYMSPEQARGKGVDRRSDIWAFGTVVYEMLTGRQAFLGDSVSDTLAAILRGQPEWDALPANTPPALRRLLERCLEKDPRRRLRDIGEARVWLEDLAEGRDSWAAVTAGPVMEPPARSAARWLTMSGWVAAALLALVALAGWLRWDSGGGRPVRKLEIPVAGRFSQPVLSPDGEQLAYLGESRVWVRDLDRFEAREVPGSNGAAMVFWSPDSAWVAFGAEDRLWKAPATSGGASVICLVPGGFYEDAGGAWLDDGRILFETGGSGLFEVSANGGDPKLVLQPQPGKEIDFHGVGPLPGGRGALFVVHRVEAADTLAIYSGGQRKDILALPGQTLDAPRYDPSGHIVYQRRTGNPGIWAIRFDLGTLAVRGEPFLVVASAHSPSLAAGGVLAAVRSSGPPLREPVWVDREGKEISSLPPPREYERFFSLSPDGERLAVAVTETGNRDIWIYDLARGSRTRFTSDPKPEASPSWSPDGAHLVYWSGPDIVTKALHGSGGERLLAQGRYPAISPDGRWLVYAAPGDNSAYYDIWCLPAEGGEPRRLVASEARKAWPRVSPDGRWLAFMSDESGSYQIYLTQFPSGEGRWQVSSSGGQWPRWSQTGDRLYFTDAERALMEVEVETRPVLRLSPPRKLFDRSPRMLTSFDVTADGRRFLMLRSLNASESPTGVTLIENWAREFGGR